MRMLSAAALAAVILCLSVRVATIESVAGIDGLVDAFMHEEHVVGVAVAVMQRGVVQYSKGFGLADAEQGVAVTPHTVFRIASISKQFTAVSILRLVAQGKVRLAAGIRTYFPEFPAGAPDPTVNQLLNHTSGLDFEEAWAASAPPATTDPALPHDPSTLPALFARTTFAFAPGARFRYNNNAFALLGLLIERVSDVSYATFVKRELLEPLGMTETYFMDATSIIPHRSRAYTLRDDAAINAPSGNPYTLFAAGGLGSTVLDLLRWRRALLGHERLDAAASQLMLTPGHLADGTPIPYGLGLFLLSMEGRAKVDHYGNTTGYRAELAYYPSDDLTVTVLANTNPARTEVLESRISRLLMDMPERAVVEIPMSHDKLRRYAGTFVVTDAPISHRSVVTEITLKDDGIYAGKFRLRPIGGDVFVPAGDPYHHYTFTVRDGQAVALRDEREERLIADAHR